MNKARTTGQAALTDATPRASLAGDLTPVDWRQVLPTLTSETLTLREPVAADALSLLTALPEDAYSQIVSAPPPPTVAGVESMITRLHAERRAGSAACWAIIPADAGVAVGLIGVRSMDHTCTMVEGICIIADEFRGTSLFQTAGRLVLGCLFGQMNVHRVEFRVDVQNGRANGALRKLGATQEGLLRRARTCDGEFRDQVLWAIVATDWTGKDVAPTASVH